MQRIDENIEIDDTLVTCAEYQLFIDEMRAKREYCQPSHWTSYQYQAGNAHESVLGVRYADAVTFCEWLTQREASEWNYRLPTNIEAHEYPLKCDQYPSPVGYWIMNANNESGFAWIGTIPDNPRGLTFVLDFANDLARSLDSTLNLDQTHLLTLAQGRARTRALDRIDDLNLNHDLTIAIAHASSDAHSHYTPSNYFDEVSYSPIQHAPDHNSNLLNDYLRDYNREQSNDDNRDFLDLIGSANKADYNLKDTINRDINLNNLTQELDVVFNRALARVLTRALNLDRHARTIDDYAELSLDLYIDLFTLQERIAGRSPAFEGIRLVKERIR